jgi:DNA polymerase III sliding clamp (beta) subunit (PCNA family)
MERTKLLELLNLVEPALSDQNLIPVLQHFWFTGQNLVAYNDQIAISVPCLTEFAAAVPGDTLLSMLKASLARNVELTLDDKGVLHITLSAAKLKLPTLPAESFIFDMPEFPDTKSLPGGNTRELFIRALDECLMSVSNDTSIPDQLGVTVIPKDKTLLLFSTNFSTLTHARLEVNGVTSLKQRIILSRPFVQQFVKLAEATGEEDIHLVLRKDHALASFGDVQLFGRLIASEHPINYEKLMQDHLPENYEKMLIDIPPKLKLILQRAIIVSDNKVDQQKTKITLKDGTIKFFSRSDKGEVDDTLPATKGQKEVSLQVEPGLMLKGVEEFDQYLLHEKSVVMTKAGVLYMVAASE